MAGGNAAAQYTYDAFGQRLVKAGASTTLYQYDQNRHLIEESDGQGNPQVDYIYVDSLSVATLSPASGQVYYLHDDRLGTPQAATDNNQNVIWAASYGPFGEMTTTPSLIVQNLRLPGQEFDADTGLYHNGFRDYAPGWGRYLQSDPIGLAGGLNTYNYVGANPVNRTDPLGLFDLHEAWTNFQTKVTQEWQIIRADYEAGEAPGGSGGINDVIRFEFPAVHGCLEKAKKAYNATKKWLEPYEPYYDAFLAAKAAVEGDVWDVIEYESKLAKKRSETGPWGDRKGPPPPSPPAPPK